MRCSNHRTNSRRKERKVLELVVVLRRRHSPLQLVADNRLSSPSLLSNRIFNFQELNKWHSQLSASVVEAS